MLRPRTIIESNKAETGRICRIIVINEQQGHSRNQTYDIEASTKSPKVFRDSGFLKPCGVRFRKANGICAGFGGINADDCLLLGLMNWIKQKTIAELSRG
jgi:hypothetical protein